MKKYFTIFVFIACAFASVGWGSTYGQHENDQHGHQDRDNGNREAAERHQTDDEDVKRAQGDERGRRDIHLNKSHENEESEQGERV